MLNLYLWLKTLHILSVIIWFLDMLWLPLLMLRQLGDNSERLSALQAIDSLELYRVHLLSAALGGSLKVSDCQIEALKGARASLCLPLSH